MKITVGKSLMIEKPTLEVEGWILSKEIPNPERESMKKMGLYYFHVPEKLKLYSYNLYANTYTLPRCLIDNLAKEIDLRSCDIKYNLNEGKKIELGRNTFNLRDYQTEAIKKAKNGGLLVAPAGSGKTVMGISLISELKVKTLWLCHSKDLLNQAVATFKTAHPEEGRDSIGILSEGNYLVSDNNKVVFALVQTLKRNTEYINNDKEFGLIIVDEAHHVPSVTFSSIISKSSAKTLIGLTATPERKDGLTPMLHAFIGEPSVEIDRAVLYARNKLVIPKLVTVYTNFESNLAFKSQESSYHEIVAELYNNFNRAKLVAETIVRYSENGLTIVLCDNINYSFKIKTLVDSICKKRTEIIHSGVSQYKTIKCTPSKYNLLKMQGLEVSEYSKGKTKIKQYSDEAFEILKCNKKKREDSIELARKGKIDILFATKLADEGLDIPNIAVVALISPSKGDSSGTKNGSSLEQRVGRAMRPYPGKKEAYILDFIDYYSGIFKNQWYSRRRTYKRLGIEVPKKPKGKGVQTLADKIFDEFEI